MNDLSLKQQSSISECDKSIDLDHFWKDFHREFGLDDSMEAIKAVADKTFVKESTVNVS